MDTRRPAHVGHSTRNFVQQAFDSEPWAPTLPDDFVVSQRNSASCIEDCRSVADQANKNMHAERETWSSMSGKIPGWEIWRTADPRKNPSGAAASDGKSQRGSSTAPPIEIYHGAQEWKNSTVRAGTFPGKSSGAISAINGAPFEAYEFINNFADPALGDPEAWHFKQFHVDSRYVLALAWRTAAADSPVKLAKVRPRYLADHGIVSIERHEISLRLLDL
jgi:hypothetical protein